MLKDDCVDLFKRMPPETHQQVNFVLHNGMMLAVDTIVRFEPNYVVFRGREGGNTDDGRAFFLPYDQVSYVKIERVVRIGELKTMFGETGYIDAEDRLSMADEAERKAAAEAEVQTPPTTPTPIPVGSSDPGSIAKQNLLARIRAARAGAGAGGAPRVGNNVGGATGKLNGDGKK
jgi:hypothetical protein